MSCVKSAEKLFSVWFILRINISTLYIVVFNFTYFMSNVLLILLFITQDSLIIIKIFLYIIKYKIPSITVTSSILIYLQFHYLVKYSISMPYLKTSHSFYAYRSTKICAYSLPKFFIITNTWFFSIFMLKTDITLTVNLQKLIIKFWWIFFKTLCMVWCSKPAVTAVYV